MLAKIIEAIASLVAVIAPALSKTSAKKEPERPKKDRSNSK
jgi:hypothetical protein